MGFSHTLRVRYHESDQMGIVHHSQYVRYLETARIEWLRHLGFSYRDMETSGALLVVAQLDIKYRAPARFDDVLDIGVVLTRLTAIRIVLDYVITRPADEAVIAKGSTTLASVDTEGQLKVMPESVRSLLGVGSVERLKR